MTERHIYAGCEAEPIHRPGSIQSFGGLMILAANSLQVFAYAGTTSTFGGVVPSNGQALDALLEGMRGEPASAVLHGAQQIALQHMRLRSRETLKALEVTVHRSAGLVLLEIEHEERWAQEDWLELQRDLQHGVHALHKTKTVADLCDVATTVVQRLTAFDRCMVYRFDADWHGEVVSETLSQHGAACSYLGHHFPASDIPPQARRIFEVNWLRIIADVASEPLPLSSTRDPKTDEPFDLSATLLRSPAPVHLEYLRNMDVSASLTISLLQNGKLWGLVTCHHTVAKHVPLSVRLACEQVGRLVSANLVVKAQQEEQSLRRSLQQAISSLGQSLHESNPIELALCKTSPNLLSVTPSAQTASAARLRGWWTFLGRVPSVDQLGALLRWLDSVVSNDGLYVTSCLQADYPPAAAYAEVASGLLAVALPSGADNYLLWFRPERLQTRTWAGLPHKSGPDRDDEGAGVTGGATDAYPQIHPRKSFAAWRETVSGTSAPWLSAEIEAAVELKKAIVEAKLVQQLDREVQMRTDLEAQKSRFKLLAEASDVLMSSLDIGLCLEDFAQRLTQQFCDSCVIYLKDAEHSWRRAVMRHHTAQGQSILEALGEFEGLHSVAGSPVAEAFSGKPVLQARVSNDWLQSISPSKTYHDYLSQKLGAESLLAVPMCTREACVGVVKFLRAERVNRFTSDDLALAVELARRAAHAVENVGLYRDANEAIVTREHVLHVVSHDLKNPVAAIALSTDAIERKVTKAAMAGATTLIDLHVPLSRIRASGRRMLRLIDDLLNVAKMEGGRFALHTQQVTTDALLQDVYLLAEPLANAKGVAVHLKNPYAGALFPCDKDRMLQVIGNLIGNAVKFTPSGGTVTLEVTEANLEHVTFAVRDTGPGISREDLPHVFDRYWQASRTAAQGTGLGLFIAQGIVQAHAGTLSVESQPAQGATFWVRLPQRPAE